MVLKFLVQGSSDEPYEVLIDKTSGLQLGCTCQAGAFGRLCKHLLNIIAGDSIGIVSGNEASLSLVPNLILGSEFKTSLDKYTELLKEKEQLEKKIKAARKDVEQTLF